MALAFRSHDAYPSVFPNGNVALWQGLAMIPEESPQQPVPFALDIPDIIPSPENSVPSPARAQPLLVSSDNRHDPLPHSVGKASSGIVIGSETSSPSPTSPQPLLILREDPHDALSAQTSSIPTAALGKIPGSDVTTLQACTLPADKSEAGNGSESTSRGGSQHDKPISAIHMPGIPNLEASASHEHGCMSHSDHVSTAQLAPGEGDRDSGPPSAHQAALSPLRTSHGGLQMIADTQIELSPAAVVPPCIDRHEDLSWNDSSHTEQTHMPAKPSLDGIPAQSQQNPSHENGHVGISTKQQIPHAAGELRETHSMMAEDDKLAGATVSHEAEGAPAMKAPQLTEEDGGAKGGSGVDRAAEHEHDTHSPMGLVMQRGGQTRRSLPLETAVAMPGAASTLKTPQTATAVAMPGATSTPVDPGSATAVARPGDAITPGVPESTTAVARLSTAGTPATPQSVSNGMTHAQQTITNRDGGKSTDMRMGSEMRQRPASAGTKPRPTKTPAGPSRLRQTTLLPGSGPQSAPPAVGSFII